MSEIILGILRKNLPGEWLRNGLKVRITEQELEKVSPFKMWGKRDQMEQDEEIKQLIPYILVESAEDGNLAIYKRVGSEKRIHGLRSVGVGGHINKEDLKPEDSFIDLIKRSALRELREEFRDLEMADELKFLGLINEEETKVGRTHLGLVFHLRVNGKPEGNEELGDLQWKPLREIHQEHLEMWSHMTLDLYNSIFNFFAGLNLTDDQSRTLRKLESFLNGKDHIFILKGYAGTGKTTLLKGIAKYLNSRYRLGGLMAPTGRAAKVIKDITGIGGSTVHRAIYDLNKLKTYKSRDKQGNESFKFFFELKAESHRKNNVYIFDEASMISDRYAEGEFFRFGSGYLLDDILSFFNTKTQNDIKLIFVGDPAQLPPVSSSYSAALDDAYFLKSGYDVASAEMTRVVRQDTDSGILINAQAYRKRIFSEKVAENRLETGFSDIEELDYPDLGKTFVSHAPRPDISKNIIITFSNERARQNNRMIRELYFPDRNETVEGDILQVIRNNYNTGLLNGEFVTVVKAADETVRQSASVWINKAQKTFRFDFRNITLHTPNGELIDTIILETLLDSKNRDLTSDEIKALYVNFIMRYEKKTGGTANRNSARFKESFRKDPFFNALQVKYGYAITGHKSHGGEWENAFVDFSGRNGTSKDELRWIYTAITRASKKLYVLNPPRESRIDLRNTEIRIGLANRITLPVVPSAEEEPIPETTPFHDAVAKDFVKRKFRNISEQLKGTGFTISNVVQRDYLEQYVIRKGQKVYRVSAWYNGKGVFTRYQCNLNDEDSVFLLHCFEQKPKVNTEFIYYPESTTLKELYNIVRKAIKDTGLNLVFVDDSRLQYYLVVYYFQANNNLSYIQFFLNGKEQVRSMVARSKLGDKDTQLHQLIDNLKK